MRIIAGQFRGRRLVAPQGLATRPTTDRVREAWFSILGPLKGTVVDLYAGTGALAFEAISRGCSHAILVESARAAQIAIMKNADNLGITARVTLLRGTVESAKKLLAARAPYDLIVTDPPWTALPAAQAALGKILRADLLTDDGRIVLGHPKGQPIVTDKDSGLEVQSVRSWGDSAATFFGRASPRASL